MEVMNRKTFPGLGLFVLPPLLSSPGKEKRPQKT